MKIIYNPPIFKTKITKPNNPNVFFDKESEGADIIDYPISEALKDGSGEPIWDNSMGTYRTTGRTLEFTLLKGQAGEFEDYVADILLNRYAFLEDKTNRVGKVVKKSLVDEEATTKEAGVVPCQTCGKTFNAADELGLHVGMKHPETLGVNTNAGNSN